MDKNIIIETIQTGDLRCNTSIIYSTSSKDAVIIDPGEFENDIVPFILDKKLKVKTLIHTHAHIDHIGSSNRLKKRYEARLLLHPDDRELYNNIHLQAFMFDRHTDNPAEIDLFFQDGFELFAEGISDSVLLKVIHTPGHSAGSCCFYTEITGKRILFSGDTLFMESVGRTDLPGAMPSKLVPSIKEKLFILAPDTQVIPGHGYYTTIGDEIKNNPFLN